MKKVDRRTKERIKKIFVVTFVAICGILLAISLIILNEIILAIFCICAAIYASYIIIDILELPFNRKK